MGLISFVSGHRISHSFFFPDDKAEPTFFLVTASRVVAKSAELSIWKPKAVSGRRCVLWGESVGMWALLPGKSDRALGWQLATDVVVLPLSPGILFGS